jgi:Glucodextranase, domain B
MMVGALFLLAVTGPVASASAIEPATSKITSPAGPTYALNDESESSPHPAFKVEGTTNIAGMVALRCYYGAGTKSYSTLASEVAVSSGAFSAVIEPKSLYEGPCVLRAVPVGNEEAHPPAAPSEEAGDPFQGPHIVGSRFRLFTESGINYDYEFEPYSLSSFLDIESVGDCGLDYSNLFTQDFLIPSDHLFDCNAVLYSEDDPTSGPSTRSELQIDGANSYSPAAAHEVEGELKTPLSGAPQVAVTKTFDSSTGLVTIDEVDPIVKCAPSTAFPPTSSSCTSFVSTGVQLERKWQTSNANQVASMTDSWQSTDGVDHSLNALYDQETVNGKEGGTYQFPGASAFSAITKGETTTLPPGAGTIYYKEDAETPREGDGEHPQGAIIYDTPPSGAISVYRSTAAKESYNGFEMPYQGTIPAGGAYTLRMAFIQSYKLSEVEALASAVLAGYPASEPPALNITSPANGTTVSSPSVTAAGTVTDKRVITSFTVDGKALAVGAGGSWSTSVALNKGANTITVLATDQAGFSTEKSVSVTYTPVPPVAIAKQVGSASGLRDPLHRPRGHEL